MGTLKRRKMCPLEAVMSGWLFGSIKREKQLNVSFPDFDRISEWTANICALFPAKAPA